MYMFYNKYMKRLFRFTKQHAFLLLAILALLIFCNSKLLVVLPFGYSFAFSLVANNFYGIIITIFYFLFSLINNLTFIGLVNSALVCSLLIIFYIVNRTYKKHPLIIMLICCAFSQLSNIYFSCSNLSLVLFALLQLCLGIAFSFICYKVVNAVLLRGIQCLTYAEKLFACIMFIVLFGGLTNIVLIINISKIIFVTIILLCSLAMGSKTLYIACFIAVAYIMSGLNMFNGLTYFVLACVASWLSPQNKILSGCAVCLADALMGIFMQYSLLDLAPVVIATLIFICIPKKIIKKVFGYVFGSNSNIIGVYYVQKKQDLIKSRLIYMGGLFKQIQKCYRDLIITQNNQEKVANFLATELKNELCANCINKLACEDKNLMPCFTDLILRAQSRGKVNLLDVPPLLSSNCCKINACLSNINQKAEEYIRQSNIVKSSDDNKLNISLQMGGTSKIFTELGNQFTNVEKINKKKSEQIKDCLQSNKIVCKECIATENNNGIHEILLLVRNADVVNPQLAKVCEKFYRLKFEQKLSFQTKVAGWSLVSLVPANRYELTCGFASTPKDIDSKNGDNYVFTKLTDSKYLVSICDGMGHGEQANNISSVAINLIESYYKCGLPSNIVVDSVNNMLLPASDAGFSTLDVSIVDTISGEVDFIKIGSAISIIKQSQTCKIVDVQSLPLGITENVVPSTFTATLFAGDVVVMVSDGVADVFASNEEFCNYINNENIINMQLFAESILEEALARNPLHKDDMSVVAYRLIQKR